jgi:eukaryotic-like serine/threonine-protein kinase
VGPIARIMVRRAAREAKDFASLIQKLGEQLISPVDRAKFLQQNARLAVSGTGPAQVTHPAEPVDDDATVVPGLNNSRPVVAPGPTGEEVTRAAQLLAIHLGPIAKVLVRQAAQPGVTRAAFLAGLADRLSESEKERFLNDFERSR